MEMVSGRRREAQRSILVQVQSAQSAKELHSYCASFGKVRNMLHYTAGTESMVRCVQKHVSDHYYSFEIPLAKKK